MFHLKAGNRRQNKTPTFVREPASLPEYSHGRIPDNCGSISRGVRGWSEMADVRGGIMKQTGLLSGAEEAGRAAAGPAWAERRPSSRGSGELATFETRRCDGSCKTRSLFSRNIRCRGSVNEEPRALSGHFDRCSTVQVSGCRAADLTASRGFCPNLAETLWRAAKSNAGY